MASYARRLVGTGCLLTTKQFSRWMCFLATITRLNSTFVKRCEGPPVSSFWTADICGHGERYLSSQCDAGNSIGGGAAGVQPYAPTAPGMPPTNGPLFDKDAQLWNAHLQTNNGSVFTCPDGDGITLCKPSQTVQMHDLVKSGEYPIGTANIIVGKLGNTFFQTSSPGFELKAGTEINLDFMQEDCSNSWVSFWLFGFTGTGKAGMQKPYEWVSHFEIDIIENYPNSHPDWNSTWAHNFNYCNGLGSSVPGLCQEQMFQDASPDGFIPPRRQLGEDHFERHFTMWVGEKDCPSDWGYGDIERFGCVRGKTCSEPSHNLTGKKCPTVFVTNCPVTDNSKQSCEKNEGKAAYHVYDVLPGDAINPFLGQPDPVHFRFVIDDWTPSSMGSLASQCVLTANNLRIKSADDRIII